MSNGRRRPEDFFAVALTILEASGFPELTAAGICERLDITRGSFYHHFKSFDVFIDELLAHWEERFSHDLIAKANAVDNLGEQVQAQVLMAAALPHGAEAAFRAWGTVEPRVAAVQQRVDSLRHDALVDSLQRGGVPARSAALYSRITLAMIIGVQMTEHPVDPQRLIELLNELDRAGRASLLQREGVEL